MHLSDLVREMPDIGEIVHDGFFHSLGDADGDSTEMLVYAVKPRYLRLAERNARVACIVTTGELAEMLGSPRPVLVSDSPREAFFRIHNYLAAKTDFYWSEFETEISPDAMVHPTAYVAPRNVRIGKGTVVEPHATILGRSIIGEDVVIRAGTVIGSEGFEFIRTAGGILSVLHAGGVKLSDRVEIQANSAIDAAVFGSPTEIGEDTKLDNMVYVAHGVRIGRRCLIAANAMIAGTVTIGDDVWIGPSAAISDHIKVGAGARVTLGAVVIRDVEPGQTVSGNFAVDHVAFMNRFREMARG